MIFFVRSFVTFMVVVFWICSGADVLAAMAVAGSVKSAAGDVSILRGETVLKAAPGQKLFQNDTLETGSDGSMGVVFRDNSTLSLGPASKIIIDKFVFSPAEGKLGKVTKMLKGTAVFLSGEIAKLSPEAVKVETPLATLGIRGTRFIVKVD